MSIYKMQLDAAFVEEAVGTVLTLCPPCSEQHETPRKAPVALSPYGQREEEGERKKKNPPGNHIKSVLDYPSVSFHRFP